MIHSKQVVKYVEFFFIQGSGYTCQVIKYVEYQRKEKKYSMADLGKNKITEEHLQMALLQVPV